MAHKYLIIKAFDKAFQELEARGISNPSKQKRAELISDFVEEEGFPLGEKTYRNYYNDALKLIDKQGEDIQVKPEIIPGLCAYVGYENYEGFVSDVKLEQQGKVTKASRRFFKKYKVVVLLCVFVGLLVFMYTRNQEQRWMQWKNDHYEEVEFNRKLYTTGHLKLYNENLINNFRKIKVECDTTVFYKKDGKVKVWYEKIGEGKYECFTMPGLHPETGKTLRKITDYIIKKICPEQISNTN